MKWIIKVAITLSGVFALCAQAQNTELDAPEPPGVLTDQEFENYLKQQPAKAEDEESAERVVRSQLANKRVEEVSIQGRRILVKIDPPQTPPYYITDKQGNGTFDEYRANLGDEPNISKWKLWDW